MQPCEKFVLGASGRKRNRGKVPQQEAAKREASLEESTSHGQSPSLLMGASAYRSGELPMLLPSCSVGSFLGVCCAMLVARFYLMAERSYTPNQHGNCYPLNAQTAHTMMHFTPPQAAFQVMGSLLAMRSSRRSKAYSEHAPLLACRQRATTKRPRMPQRPGGPRAPATCSWTST